MQREAVQPLDESVAVALARPCVGNSPVMPTPRVSLIRCRAVSRSVRPALLQGRLQAEPARKFTQDAAERSRRRFCFWRREIAQGKN